MRLLVAAGASGGGVYPALAVLQELADDSIELLWVGGEGGMEEDLVARAGYQLTSLPAAGLHGVGLRALPGNLWQLFRGYLSARKLLRDFNPDVLFFTGGFVAAPVALAGIRFPSLAFVPDIKPGLALRLVSRFTDLIALVTEESRKFVRGQSQTRISGYPLRRELTKWKQAEARAHFGLNSKLPVLLVFGGSKGAQAINEELLQVLPELVSKMQVLHITGERDWDEIKTRTHDLPPKVKKNYLPFPYLHDDMGAALAAADLVLSRAGASTLGEFPVFNLPALLVPIPFEKHIQHINAAFLEKKGAAMLIPEDQMKTSLATILIDLITDTKRLNQMAAAMAKLARPQAAKTLATYLHELAEGSYPA